MVYPAGSIKMGSGNNYHPNGMHIQLDLYKWGQVITIIQSIYPAGTIQMGSGNNYHPNGIFS